MNLGHIKITQALKKGQNKPMKDTTVLQVSTPVRMNLNQIFKGGASIQNVTETIEFLSLSAGAFWAAQSQSTDQSLELLKQSSEHLHQGCLILYKYLQAVSELKEVTPSTEEVEVLNDVFALAVQGHRELPEWTFISAATKLYEGASR